MVAELLTAAADALGEAQLIADWHAEYITERDKLDVLVKALPANVLIDPEKGKLNDALTKAKAQAEAHKYPAAMKLLQKGDLTHETAQLKLKMHSKTVPDEADLKKLAGHRPDGLDMLDELVAGLPPDTPRKVLKAAMEARYNIKLKMFTKDAKDDKNDPLHQADMDKGSKSLKKIYELMKIVPESHTTDNESMKLVKRYGGKSSDVANYYESSEAVVALSCGRSDDAKIEKLCENDELINVHPDCQPVGAPPKAFDFTTLHEVGHSVDDKLGFMKKNGNSADYGGWEDYGGDVMPVAEAGAAEFKYDKTYLAKYLTGEPCVPPARDDKLAADDKTWEENRTKAEKWCRDIKNKLWWKGQLSEDSAVGTPKRVYQQSYDRKWVSYLLESRTKGITGYQFRAPGEWFAELYAAYFCESLGPKHPAVAWLKEMKRPEKK